MENEFNSADREAENETAIVFLLPLAKRFRALSKYVTDGLSTRWPLFLYAQICQSLRHDLNDVVYV